MQLLQYHQHQLEHDTSTIPPLYLHYTSTSSPLQPSNIDCRQNLENIVNKSWSRHAKTLANLGLRTVGCGQCSALVVADMILLQFSSQTARVSIF